MLFFLFFRKHVASGTSYLLRCKIRRREGFFQHLYACMIIIIWTTRRNRRNGFNQSLCDDRKSGSKNNNNNNDDA